MANITAITNEDFEQNVIQSKVPVLVDFFADFMLKASLKITLYTFMTEHV